MALFEQVTSPGSSVANQKETNVSTDQAIDRGTKAINDLVDMTQAGNERDVSELQNNAAAVVQARLNEIKGEKNVDVVQSMKVNPEELNRQFVEKSGVAGAELTASEFAQIQSGIDNQLSSTIERETIIDSRNSRLDQKGNEALWSEYRAKNPGKSHAQLRDGWQKFIDSKPDMRRTKNAVAWGAQRSFEQSVYEEGANTGEINLNTEQLAKARGTLAKYQTEAGNIKATYDQKYDGGKAHQRMPLAQQEDAIHKFITEGKNANVDIFQDWFADKTGLQLPGQAIKVSGQISGVLNRTIVSAENDMKIAALDSIRADLADNKERSKGLPDGAALDKLKIERGYLEDEKAAISSATEPFVINQDALNVLLINRGLFNPTDSTGIGGLFTQVFTDAGELNPIAAEKIYKDGLKGKGRLSDLRPEMGRLYRRQKNSRLTEQELIDKQKDVSFWTQVTANRSGKTTR